MEKGISRTKNTLNNISSALIGQIVSQVANFAIRTVFIQVLNAEYLGVNGLFTNILSVFSLAELGVGSAMIYSMYKPMADNDTESLKSYMDLYKKIYRIIGAVVITGGLLLTPFLDFFVTGRPDFINLELVYVLYVLSTSSTYFIAYKQSIFRASQQVHIITKYTMYFTLIRAILEIIFLIATKNFIVYLLITIFISYSLNIALAIKANKEFPFLKEKNIKEVSVDEKKNLFKNVTAMFLNKASAVILSSTDNIILSKYIGLIFVGIYSNYSMVITVIRIIFYTIFDGITPSVGNLCATQSDEKKKYQVFKTIFLLNCWVSGFFSICLFVLLNPFIELWIGKNYLLGLFEIAAIIISFYIQTTMSAVGLFRAATGLFYNDRYFSVAQCIINIIVSVCLVNSLGVAGIFIGTSVAMLTTLFWVQPYLVFKKIFNKSPIFYFWDYIKYLIIMLVSLFVVELCVSITPNNTVFTFIYKMVCCLIIPNLIVTLLCFRTDEFQDLWNRGIVVVKNIFNKFIK